METDESALMDAGAAKLPDLDDVLQRYGQSAEIVGEYDIPDEGDQVEVVENGRVRVTKTTRVLVRVTPVEAVETDEGQAVTLRSATKSPLSPSDENKEFYSQMEKERKKIIAVQRRSTPDESAMNYPSSISADLNGQFHSINEENVDPGEVDDQSILDNKDNTKQFLINKMLEGSQNNNDSRIDSKQTTLQKEFPLASSKAASPPLKMATSITANGINGSEHAAAVPSVSMVNGKQEQMHLVEARLCFIDQTTVLPSFNGIKRDKSTSTIITENKIAQEIEECRMREEELKLQRFERCGRVEEHETGSTKDVFMDEPQTVSVVANIGLVESLPIDMERQQNFSPMPSLTPMSEIFSQTIVQEAATPEVSKQSCVDEDFASSRIKVRPLQDDDDDKPMYVVYKESAVEREIRLTKEREAELRREKSQRELVLKANLQQEQSSVILKDVSLLTDLKQVPVLKLEGMVADSSSVDISSPNSEVFQSTLEVPALIIPSYETSALKSPLIEAPVQNGHVSLTQKRSGPNLTLPATKSNAASRITEQNMASARLQEEVNEVIQKELALKEAGSIATTSQDRIDEKVINIRQYKVERSPSTTEQQTSPPLISTPPISKEAPITSNGSPHTPMARRVSFTGQSNVTPRSTLNRSPTTKGLMAKFINSKGRMRAMSTFVPKVTKAPLEVIANPVPQASLLEIPTSLHHTQLLNTKEEETSSVNSIEQLQVKQKPEILTYRRSYSMVENKILSELRDMKEREEELRKQRTATYRRNSNGSLESLLESEDSVETNGQSDTLNGFDDIFPRQYT